MGCNHFSSKLDFQPIWEAEHVASWHTKPTQLGQVVAEPAEVWSARVL